MVVFAWLFGTYRGVIQAAIDGLQEQIDSGGTPSLDGLRAAVQGLDDVAPPVVPPAE